MAVGCQACDSEQAVKSRPTAWSDTPLYPQNHGLLPIYGTGRTPRLYPFLHSSILSYLGCLSSAPASSETWQRRPASVSPSKA